MLIDLDVVRPVPVRRRRVRDWRVLAVPVVLLALGLLAGGSVAPRPALVALASVSAGDITAIAVTGHELYVADEIGLVRTVSAYALPGGRPRWRIRVPATVSAMWWLADARVLLVSEYATGGGRVVALDSGTGAELWSRARASVLDAPPGGRALLEWPAGPGGTELGWVGVRAGQAVWSRPVPTGVDVAVAHGPSGGALLVTTADGAARLLAEDSGAVLASGQLGSMGGTIVLTPGPPGRAPAPQFLVQRRRGAGTGSLTGFDPSTLAPRWRLTGDLLGQPFRCGQLLCLGSMQGMRALDPGTGAVRWRTDRWQYASPLGGQRLLGYRITGGIAVLDAGTGRTLRILDPQWTQVLLGPPDPAGGPRPALLARRDTRTDRYWLASLAASVSPLGSLAGVDAQSCSVYPGMLACQTRAGRLGVWRYPMTPARS
jgi:outer membrane protein assembly factor BamB